MKTPGPGLVNVNKKRQRSHGPVEIHGIFHGIYWDIPSGKLRVCELENHHFEIVKFPMKKMVGIFPVRFL